MRKRKLYFKIWKNKRGKLEGSTGCYCKSNHLNFLLQEYLDDYLAANSIYSRIISRSLISLACIFIFKYEHISFFFRFKRHIQSKTNICAVWSKKMWWKWHVIDLKMEWWSTINNDAQIFYFIDNIYNLRPLENIQEE